MSRPFQLPHLTISFADPSSVQHHSPVQFLQEQRRKLILNRRLHKILHSFRKRFILYLPVATPLKIFLCQLHDTQSGTALFLMPKRGRLQRRGTLYFNTTNIFRLKLVKQLSVTIPCEKNQNRTHNKNTNCLFGYQARKFVHKIGRIYHVQA